LPRRETEADRIANLKVAESFCNFMSEAFGRVMPHRLPMRSNYQHDVNFEARADDGSLKFSFQTKCRRINFGQYSTMFIDLKKVEAAFKRWTETGKPVFWAIEFDDGISAYADLCWNSEDRYTGKGGRLDRSDPNDIDDVLHIPIDQFRRWK
jgi:hypothetical protein